MASEWAKFLVSREHLVTARTCADTSAAGPPPERAHARPAAEIALVVTLEVLLDVRDIARLAMAELRPLQRALSHVDREVSIASWSRAEPAAITAWRRGLVRRMRMNDVAGAILHALEPYHALLREANPARPTVAVGLPAARVASIRRNAVMMAWFRQMRRIIDRDPVERGAWVRYWLSVTSPMGTFQDTILWQRGARQRADTGSEAARRVVETVLERDRTLEEIDRATLLSDAIVIHVPGITRRPPPAGSATG